MMAQEMIQDHLAADGGSARSAAEPPPWKTDA
jgi:hypothetical protein